MKRFLVFNIFFLFSFYGFSQVTINGTLKTLVGKPISGASVTIRVLNTDTILNYSISNKQGDFSISINTQEVEVLLKIRSMGYKTVTKTINNKNQKLDLILEEEITKLEEVVVKTPPITRKGDTLNYSVSSFSKKEDRTIADVLKNMPGIEVLDNGKILYQGKPINKYYIEGLDLLEGKYNLANKNLPHKAVTKVQVLENHQPIKILDSLVYSNQAAINIKLKKSYTLTGQAELGSGLPNLLWDANLTPMLFSKNKQMISTYQANNVGKNIASQLKTLTFEDLIAQIEQNDENQDWLSIQKIQPPNFSDKRWLDNNAHLISTNYLEKLKKDYELRLNVSYLNDYQQQKGYTNTQFFTANDTIILSEEKYNQLYESALETNFTLQKNIDDNFFKNSIQFKGFWNSQNGAITLNNNNVNQNLSNHYFKLSNNLKTLFPVGKQVVTLKSYIGFNRIPQSLTVNPGQFINLLNNGNTYNKLVQNIELNRFYSNNSITFTKGWKLFSFSPKVGFMFEQQDLESKITGSNTTQNTNFENNLGWKHLKAYFDLETQFTLGKWRFMLKTPINFYTYELEDKPLNRGQNLNRITFEPVISINYEITPQWRLSTSITSNNQFGRINQIYYNYILKNYRNIQRIDSPLPEILNLRYSFFIGYRNPIDAIFFNVNYSNALTNSNLLYNNKILSSGATQVEALESKNERLNHNFGTTVSKYFSSFNTSFTLKTNYSLQDFQQLLNSEIIDISNQNWRLNGKIDIDITDWLNTKLEATLQFSNNKIQEFSSQTIKQEFYKFNMAFYPKENQYLGFNTQFIRNNLFSENTENFFADILYRFSLKKKNIDLELKLNNIFNTDNFRTVNFNNFSYIESNFSLRPRQILLNIRFSL